MDIRKVDIPIGLLSFVKFWINCGIAIGGGWVTEWLEEVLRVLEVALLEAHKLVILLVLGYGVLWVLRHQTRLLV